MSIFGRVRRAWVRLCLDGKRLWEWHTIQMENGRYARTFIQGVVRALWQRSVERFVLTLMEAAVELYLIVRQDGVASDHDDGVLT